MQPWGIMSYQACGNSAYVGMAQIVHRNVLEEKHEPHDHLKLIKIF